MSEQETLGPLVDVAMIAAAAEASRRRRTEEVVTKTRFTDASSIIMPDSLGGHLNVSEAADEIKESQTGSSDTELSRAVALETNAAIVVDGKTFVCDQLVMRAELDNSGKPVAVDEDGKTIVAARFDPTYITMTVSVESEEEIGPICIRRYEFIKVVRIRMPAFGAVFDHDETQDVDYNAEGEEDAPDDESGGQRTMKRMRTLDDSAVPVVRLATEETLRGKPPKMYMPCFDASAGNEEWTNFYNGAGASLWKIGVARLTLDRIQSAIRKSVLARTRRRRRKRKRGLIPVV
jgi:hypothetical protein